MAFNQFVGIRLKQGGLGRDPGIEKVKVGILYAKVHFKWLLDLRFIQH